MQPTLTSVIHDKQKPGETMTQCLHRLRQTGESMTHEAHDLLDAVQHPATSAPTVTPPKTEPKQPPAQTANDEPEQQLTPNDTWSKDELLEYCNLHGIEVKDKRSKAKIIESIKGK